MSTPGLPPWWQPCVASAAASTKLICLVMHMPSLLPAKVLTIPEESLTCLAGLTADTHAM